MSRFQMNLAKKLIQVKDANALLDYIHTSQLNTSKQNGQIRDLSS
ncbi:unnamed protein product [Arabidopsis lyrata]|nr:unnamed protein product [Arabidopsis lyrata]